MSVATSTTLATAGRSAPRVGAASRGASRQAVAAPACGCGVAGNCAHVRTGPFVLRADRRRVSAVAARASSDDGSKRDVGFGTTPRGMGFFNNDDTSSSSSSSLTLRSTPSRPSPRSSSSRTAASPTTSSRATLRPSDSSSSPRPASGPSSSAAPSLRWTARPSRWPDPPPRPPCPSTSSPARSPCSSAATTTPPPTPER